MLHLHRTRTTKSLLFVILSILFLVFAQPVFADRIINSVTLNGASSVTVAPSTSITAAVNVTTNALNDKNWRSTSWNISGSNCINHTDHNGAGTYNESFIVTAPSSSGTYNISFIAYADSTCSLDASPTHTLTGGIVVVTPTPTPGPGTPTPTPTPSSSSSSSSSTTNYPSVSLNTYFPNPTNTVPLTFLGLAAIEQGIIALVEYTLTEGASWISAQPVDGNFNGKDEQFSFTTSNVSEGTYRVKVRAKSGAGVITQEGSYASQTVTVATTPPHVTLDTISPNPTKNQTPTLTARATAKLVDIARVEISIDGGASWQLARKSGNTYSLTLAKLEDGNYPVIARAFDRAGNSGTSETQTLIVDTIPPIIGGGMQSIGPQILTPDEQGTISIVSGTETTIAISMKGGVTGSVIKSGSSTFALSPKEGTPMWVGKIKFDSGGEKPLTISAVDGAGNTTERTFHTLTVEQAGRVEDKQTNRGIERGEVSVYFFENISQQWVLWEAQSYGQRNPQKTDATGRYSFMVPAGKYYIEVDAAGYKSLQSEIITVTQTSIFNDILPLTPKPKIEFTLPILGKIVLTLPSFSPPESFSVQTPSPTPGGALESPAWKPGTPAPNFSLPNLENKNISLGSFRGKKVLLSFIASWSSLSLEQAPFLTKAASDLSDDQAMLVVMVQESPAITRTLMNQGKYAFPVVVDTNGTSATNYNVLILPHHVFVNSNGRIQDVFTGVLTREELLQRLSDVP